MAADERRKVGRFFREIKAEMKKVTWPTRNDLLTYTEVVLVVVIAFTLLIFLADSAFSYLLKLIIKS
ncbi:MAG: preprotein translocase subunit SecE [Thermoanaerobacterium sp.]|jgi:preprotein translocase, SecE subunit, bacterial|uniref:preprotein translocase subunit SecE n=1 Tax=Thermoanaerobacterium thermosaccharolyticum TaxID=1517 RepID=UPI00177A7D74|nr:preprotein translocase subunit SecE [Thermoanaerobacterium thermosaccharolyticum]MDI3477605.1 preprotein translocase subunit SecE [Thermoanaerobacterium sp.]MBE0069444.1 preprotein translocase subunit SecE [Thermoanaerobacterium thermosaccharolyticum]MBE0229124.1 preprotein translocase subunit SecE [Thermoanaerobacterium thermosaccharolyticum]MCP2241155.1 preprotein translocase subunit SecE [Thermoanaerobacterium thermosaccharolyticum]MDK2806689.1 preprotein translocase subunit SecE [Thermo